MLIKGISFLPNFLIPAQVKRFLIPCLLSERMRILNDVEDVIVCKCSSQPKPSGYDILVSLKKPTVVRTNKTYTIRRNLLRFKIMHSLSSAEIASLLDSVDSAVTKR